MGAAKSSQELDALKEQAKELGITFSPNIGLDALQKKVNYALGSQLTNEETTPKETTEVQKTLLGIKEATKLHRVIVNCLHPDKRNYSVELISVGNTKYGFVTRAIKLGEPWHIEDILYRYLKNKKYYNNYVKEKTINGIKRYQIINELKNEYEVTDLPPLTMEELEKLKIDQSSSGRIKDDLDN